MFKKIIVILFLFINNLLFSQIRQGKITYQASINKDLLIKETESDKSSKETRQMILKYLMDSSEIYFSLIFNRNQSLFYAEKEKMENEGDNKMNFTKISSGSRNIYYNNIKTKEKFRQNLSFDKLLIELEPTKWTLTTEKKRIGKYICYKAMTNFSLEGRSGIMNRSVIAWYTIDIPVSFGIQNFDGLPGLTLELSIDKKTIFKAIKIELNPKEIIEIRKPKGKKISSKEFNKKIKNTNKRY
jgi:GLPGLI family protein